MQPHWEHFDHQADIGIRGWGRTMEQAFEQAALAMTAVIVDPATVRPAEDVEICCEAADRELLLVDWLSALLCEMAARRMLFSRFAVTVRGNVLRGRASGERVDSVRHEPAVEVKGASYLDLRVAPEGDGWVAQCVVDV